MTYDIFNWIFQKLIFVRNADTKTWLSSSWSHEVEHEISEPALFLYLLNKETIK
jgi:hypothetical protein